MDSSRLETIVTPDASPTAGDPVARARALVPLLAAHGPEMDRRQELTPEVVETNLVWFEVLPEAGTGASVQAALKAAGVLVSAAGPRHLRACLHHDVSATDAERAASLIRRAVRAAVPA